MKNVFVYRSMHMLCATPEFGDQLFDLFTPLDLSAFLHAFDISITKQQYQRYMQFWRQIFIDRGWMLRILSHGFEISFVGNDLLTIIDRVRNPRLMNNGKRKLYLGMNLVSCAASRRYPLSSEENLEIIINEKNKHYKEFGRTGGFNLALRTGLCARYAELITGYDKNGAVWLDLTITSSVKHQRVCGSYFTGVRVDDNMSIALDYGEETMQKRPSTNIARGSAIDTGALLKFKNASDLVSSTDMSVSGSWWVTEIVGKTTFANAYLFRQKRLFDF